MAVRGLARPTTTERTARILDFSRNTWLPELQSGFLKLATAIRTEDPSGVRFMTHRIRGCAAMGGANEIVGNMNDLDSLAADGQWLRARGRFRDANYLLRAITEFVASEYNNLAS